jgi:hypothetical protein
MWRWVLAVCLVGAAAGARFAEALAQDVTPVVHANAERTERDGRAVIRVDVAAENVSDLGAFEFVLTFDSDLLALADEAFVEGAFLKSSGRTTLCPEPIVDAGAARFECVTLGPTPRAGATGSGLLASVFFEPRGDGKATVRFARAKLSSPLGDEIPADWIAGEINVDAAEGAPWWLWLAAGGGGAALVLAAAAAFVWRLRSNAARAVAPPVHASSEDRPSATF